MPERKSSIALTIAGSDSSGGAGIQADLKTFTALGVYGASVLTALTAQSTTGVSGVHAVPPAFVVAQMTAVMDDLAVDAIKTGMLATREIVEAVADLLARYPRLPVVVDPVMVATSGDILLAADAIEAVRQRLIPRAEIITPNLPEAARLLGVDIARSEAEMDSQARALLALGPRAVLLKGGHGSGAEAVDILVTSAGAQRLALPRLSTRNTHGTGCTLSAAIAGLRARGLRLTDAVRAAKSYLWQALQAGAGMSIGKGNGPVDHIYAIRPSPAV
jgi:hydroxymethylpyrimidine/phosphomethylpyrimidine kinase